MARSQADRVRHLPRIAVNDTWRLAPDAEIIYAGDRPWWDRNPEARAAPGLKVTVEGPDRPLPGLLVLRNSGGSGFDPDPGALRTQRNSGGAAVHLAVHTGASRILLLGLDLNGHHWYDKRRHTPQTFRMWLAAMDTLAREIAGRVEVINCSLSSSIRCFPKMTLDDALLEVAA